MTREDANILMTLFKKIISSDGNGNHLLRTSASLTLDADEELKSDIRSVGDVAVPTSGAQPIIPIGIYDGAGNQITSLGSPSYRGEFNSPVDFVATYATPSTISISGLSGFVIEDNSQIAGVKVIHADNTSEIFANGSGEITFTHSGGVITIHGATPFVTGDKYEVGINAQKKSYDQDTQSTRVSNIVPEWAHYTDVDHAVAETGLTNGTSYYLSVDIDGFRSAAIQLQGTNVTFTAYMTLNGDADDADETDESWVDATTDLFGSATVVTTTSESNLGFIETLRMPAKILIKYTITNATNAVDIWVRKY